MTIKTLTARKQKALRCLTTEVPMHMCKAIMFHADDSHPWVTCGHH